MPAGNRPIQESAIVTVSRRIKRRHWAYQYSPRDTSVPRSEKTITRDGEAPGRACYFSASAMIFSMVSSMFLTYDAAPFTAYRLSMVLPLV